MRSFGRLPQCRRLLIAFKLHLRGLDASGILTRAAQRIASSRQDLVHARLVPALAVRRLPLASVAERPSVPVPSEHAQRSSA